MGDAADDAERRADIEREEGMSDEVTTHQIQGVCEGVMVRGDWQEYHINVGRQYPVKLATKQPDVKEAATAAGQQEAVWTYTQRDGNPNPHRPGEFFKNRYLSKVEVGGVLDPALAGQQQTQNAPASTGSGAAGTPRNDRERRSIERQTVVKAALPTYLASYGNIPEAEFFALIDRTADWIAQEPDAPAPTEEVLVANPDDDDIPF